MEGSQEILRQAQVELCSGVCLLVGRVDSRGRLAAGSRREEGGELVSAVRHHGNTLRHVSQGQDRVSQAAHDAEDVLLYQGRC